jgi:mycoredoxin-dependent peroxiredoxin
MSFPETRLARFSSVSSLNETDGHGPGIGTPAPDFTLRDQFGQDVTLSSFRGQKAVALVFFPWAFSNVCTSEMAGIRDRLDRFLTFDTEVLAISTDATYSLRVFADTDGLNFPLLSDFWPHGRVARAYGVFDGDLGVARRSSFVVDRAGVVRWAVHNELPDGRDLEDHLAQLHHLA